MKPRKSRSWFESAGYAFSGIRNTARRERNFRIQIIMAILAVLACIIFQVNAMQFVLVGFAIFFVLSTELINTAIEAIVDMLTGGKAHPLAKIAKDAAAGAVFLASVFALIVAATIAASVIGRFVE
ncbi:MAG: diacylglycerol kinase family protein [Defluviitaleaceae bacterium]|nr:diacylglycerol kinase family protein [Defluviitaleaceae bacterium]